MLHLLPRNSGIFFLRSIIYLAHMKGVFFVDNRTMVGILNPQSSAIKIILFTLQFYFDLVQRHLTLESLPKSPGLRIPFDSTEFRTKFLDPTNVMDSFIFHRRLWPSPEYYELMALAQHHGLPTRLLDWSHKSYVAAYFAASEALSNKVAERLAVWALNTQYTLPRLTKMEIIRVPGSNNANVAAQAGVFTLLRQEYTRGKPFDGPECLCDYAVSSGSNSLMKITLPLAEAPKIIDLCERHGITAAILFPDFYGAARATLDNQACWSRAEWTDGSDIRAKTTYALTPSANGVSDKS
jgi:hypothetical protein